MLLNVFLGDTAAGPAGGDVGGRQLVFFDHLPHGGAKLGLGLGLGGFGFGRFGGGLGRGRSVAGAGFVDAADRFTDLHGGAFGRHAAQHTRCGGGHVDVGFVGFEFT